MRFTLPSHPVRISDSWGLRSTMGARTDTTRRIRPCGNRSRADCTAAAATCADRRLAHHHPLTTVLQGALPRIFAVAVTQCQRACQAPEGMVAFERGVHPCVVRFNYYAALHANPVAPYHV